MGDVEAKELICTTHGRNAGERGCAGERGIKWRKNGAIVIA